MSPKYTFAERLQQYMDVFKLTKSDVATIIQRNVSNIARYLDGSYEAKADSILKLSAKYNVDPAWILGYDVPMFRDMTSNTLANDGVSELDVNLYEQFSNLPKELQESIRNQITYLASISKT